MLVNVQISEVSLDAVNLHLQELNLLASVGSELERDLL
jgi:hypothetical protein